MEKYVLTTEPFTFETKLERPNFVVYIGIFFIIISPLVGLSLAIQVEKTSSANFTKEFHFLKNFKIMPIS